MKVKKAVIPAAGFGTRFLPTTKAMPKEMINIVDMPAIQYVVEEAVASGIEEILIILSRGKEMIMNHFDETPELDRVLKEKPAPELLELSQSIARKAKIFYTRQGRARGLGHAILCAREFIGDEPFAVLLPDDIMDAKIPVTRQLIDGYEEREASILGVQPVPREDLSKYGIVSGEPLPGGDWLLDGMIEKPQIEEAPSDLAILGRYVLTPAIFDMIEATPPGKGREVQLTDAILRLKRSEPVYARPFDGMRYDSGNKLGYLKATLNFALKHPDLKDELKAYLKEIDLD